MEIRPDQLAQLVTKTDLKEFGERLPSRESFNTLTGAVEDLATAVKDLRTEMASHEFRFKRLEDRVGA